MSDIELLELAAKAAGMRYSANWNPLDEDGDALRLAVELGMLVDSDKSIEASEAWPPGLPFVREEWARNGDRYAATRRAIVRAAAEIGRTMP